MAKVTLNEETYSLDYSGEEVNDRLGAIDDIHISEDNINDGAVSLSKLSEEAIKEVKNRIFSDEVFARYAKQDSLDFNDLIGDDGFSSAEIIYTYGKTVYNTPEGTIENVSNDVIYNLLFASNTQIATSVKPKDPLNKNKIWIRVKASDWSEWNEISNNDISYNELDTDLQSIIIKIRDWLTGYDSSSIKNLQSMNQKFTQYDKHIGDYNQHIEDLNSYKSNTELKKSNRFYLGVITPSANKSLADYTSTNTYDVLIHGLIMPTNEFIFQPGYSTQELKLPIDNGEKTLYIDVSHNFRAGNFYVASVRSAPNFELGTNGQASVIIENGNIVDSSSVNNAYVYNSDLNNLIIPGNYGFSCSDSVQYHAPKNETGSASVCVLPAYDGVIQIFTPYGMEDSPNDRLYIRTLSKVMQNQYEVDCDWIKFKNYDFEINEINKKVHTHDNIEALNEITPQRMAQWDSIQIPKYNISELLRLTGTFFYNIPCKEGDFIYLTNDTTESITDLSYNDDVKYIFSAPLEVGKTYPCLMLRNIISTVDEKIDGLIYTATYQGINNLMLSSSITKELSKIHTHSNKAVLDAMTQAILDKLNGIPLGANPNSNDRDDNYNNILHWYHDGCFVYPISYIDKTDNVRLEYGDMIAALGELYILNKIGCDGHADFGPGNVLINQTPGQIDCTRVNTNGADNAKYFEWVDGNPDKEDRIGLFVTLEEDKIRLANADDNYILGIISGMASTIGNSYETNWCNKYQKDLYGRIITTTKLIPAKYDNNGEKIKDSYSKQEQLLNPDYNPELEYIPRSQRAEWDVVGLSGIMVLRDDGSCAANGYCIPTTGGIATYTNNETRFRVLKRLDTNHIKVYVK